MAFLKFRGNTTSPTKPGSTTAGNAPLTNTEIDGNFASLNDGKLENSGTTNHIGNVTFGNQTSAQGFSTGGYLNTNTNKLVFRPSLDVDATSKVDSSDALKLLQWISGTTINTPFNGAPYIIQHANKTATGIAMYHSDPLAWGASIDQNPAMIITAGDTAVSQYIRVGGSSGSTATDFSSAATIADVSLKGTTVAINSTTATTNAYTGALVVGGGVGIGGNLVVGGNDIKLGGSIIGMPSTNMLRYTSNELASSGATFSVMGSNGQSLGEMFFTLAATQFGPGQRVEVLSTTASSSTATGALIVSGGVGVAGTVYANSAVLTNALPATSGGTGTATYATGDILYASAANTLSKLNIGSTGQLLTVTAGVPAWQPAPISLPSQTGNSGKFLTTNGTTSSWADAAQSVTDDTSSTAITNYIQFTTVTSGTITATKVSSTKLYYQPSTGTLNSTTFNSLSDARFKTDLEKIKGALSKVKQLTGYTFTMTESGKRSAGLLAQDVKPVSPESIGGTEDRMTLNYDSLFGLIVEAIKEIDDKLTSIEQRLDK